MNGTFSRLSRLKDEFRKMNTLVVDCFLSDVKRLVFDEKVGGSDPIIVSLSLNKFFSVLVLLSHFTLKISFKLK